MLLIIIIFLILLSTFSSNNKKIEIIYFRNDNCRLIANTDDIINEAIETFEERIDVIVINAKLIETDPDDLEEVKMLREKYNVIGLPDIIIDGKKFTKKFTKDNIFNEICNNFIIKPGVCL